MRITIDVSQDRTAPNAKGSVKLIDSDGRTVLEAREFGLVQRHGGWASFTGRGVARPGDVYRAFSAVVERADPWLADRAPSITIAVDGFASATGRGSVRLTPR